MEDINKAGGVNAVMKEMTKRGDDILLDKSYNLWRNCIRKNQRFIYQRYKYHSYY